MKNLILTFALSLVSVLTFGQQTVSIVMEFGNNINLYLTANKDILNLTITGISINDEATTFTYDVNTKLNRSEIQFMSIDGTPCNIGDSISANKFNVTWVNVPYVVDLTNLFASLSTTVIEVNSLSVYPNPVNNILNISFDVNESVDIVVTNMNGQVVYSDNTQVSTQVDMSALPQGLYFVNVGNKTKKVIKQ